VKNTLKKYFIPHQENDHQPHILRYETAIVLLAIVLVAETLFLVQSLVVIRRIDFFAAILPDVLVDETNLNRDTASIGTLTTNPLLQEAARLKALDMAENGYFAHTSPSGVSPWYWLEKAGYEFSAAGENLAVNFVDSSDVTKAWMNSPSHKANILNGNYTEIGIATAKGTYKGYDTTFVVQFFGKPAPTFAETVTEEIAQEKGKEVAAVIEKEVASASTPTEEMAIDIEEVFTGGDIEIDIIEVVAAAEGEFAPQASFTEKLAVNPKTSVDFLLTTLGTIIALALLLKIFVKVDIQYPRLIVNGASLLIIIASSILLNQYISLGTEII